MAGERPAEALARRSASPAELGPLLALLVDSGVPTEATVGERLIEGAHYAYWRLVPWSELGAELQDIADGKVQPESSPKADEPASPAQAAAETDPEFRLNAYQDAALGLNDAAPTAEASLAGTCGGLSEQGTWQLPALAEQGRPLGSTPSWTPLRAEHQCEAVDVVERSLAEIAADHRHSLGREEVLCQARRASGLADASASARLVLQALAADWSGWTELIRRGWWAAWAHEGSRRQIAQLEELSASEAEIEPAVVAPSAAIATRAPVSLQPCTVPFRAILDGPQRYLFVRAISVPLSPAAECAAPLAMSAPREESLPPVNELDASRNVSLWSAHEAMHVDERTTQRPVVMNVFEEPVLSISPPEGEPFRVVEPLTRPQIAMKAPVPRDEAIVTATQPVDADQLTQRVAGDLSWSFGGLATDEAYEPCPSASTVAAGNSLLVAGRAIGAYLAPVLEWAALWSHQFEVQEQQFSHRVAEWLQAAEIVRNQVRQSAGGPTWTGEAARLSLPEDEAVIPSAGL